MTDTTQQLAFPLAYTPDVRVSGPVVYLLHFNAPLGNPTNPRAQASHYTGWALDLDSRLATHRAGQGAAITRAAVERGIGWDVFVLGAGDWHLEKRLKALHNSARLCPRCCTRHARGGHPQIAARLAQLALDLDGDPFDVPMPWPDRPDWYELRYRRLWTGYYGTPAIDGETWDIPF